MRALLPSVILASFSVAAAAQDKAEVSPQDVKRFIDPTTLINSVGYTFEASFLLRDVELYNHTVDLTWALNHWSAVWAEVPFTHFSLPEPPGSSGVGDVLLGWGGIIHEDLERRLTTSVGGLEVLVPTGSPENGTGGERWVLTPLAALALNPTDLFPVYIRGRYMHSIGGSEGAPVRALELSVETAHILPKGFYVSAIPTFFFDFAQDRNFFSFGLGMGRALTRNFAWGAAYVHYVAGAKTFSQGFSFGLSYIWGDEKVAHP
jgi:hypothetical protein